MERSVTSLLLAWLTLSPGLFILNACNNVLPKALEEKVRRQLAEAEERKRMRSEVAIFETDKGKFTIRFFAEDAPKSVLHLRRLIESKFYDGLRFHRAIRTPAPFLIQTGDPVTRGEPEKDFLWEGEAGNKPIAGYGSSPQTVVFEKSSRRHVRGVVALARRESSPQAGSQFFIVLAPQPKLDGKYTIVGEVIDGMEVVDRIERGDKILKARLVEAR